MADLDLTDEEILREAEKIRNLDLSPPMRKAGAQPKARPSQATLERFSERLAEIFNEQVAYIYVPFWAIEDEYDAIQDADDPSVCYLRDGELRQFMAKWFSYHCKTWMVRSRDHRTGMKARGREVGSLGYLNGYGKRGEYWVDPETQVWPPGCYRKKWYPRPQRRAMRDAQAASNTKTESGT